MKGYAINKDEFIKSLETCRFGRSVEYLDYSKVLHILKELRTATVAVAPNGRYIAGAVKSCRNYLNRNGKPYVNKITLADCLGVSRATLYNWNKAGVVSIEETRLKNGGYSVKKILKQLEKRSKVDKNKA